MVSFRIITYQGSAVFVKNMSECENEKKIPEKLLFCGTFLLFSYYRRADCTVVYLFRHFSSFSQNLSLNFSIRYHIFND